MRSGAEAGAVATTPPPVEVICGDEPERRDERSNGCERCKMPLKDAQGLPHRPEAIAARGRNIAVVSELDRRKMDEVVIAVLVAVGLVIAYLWGFPILSRVVCPQTRRGRSGQGAE